MMKWIVIGVIGLVVTVLYFLPTREIVSFLDFKFFPATAKIRHLRALKDDSGRKIVLIGTIHYDHLNSEAYSLWELKALLAYFRPDLVLVEIPPEAASENHWGEGPIEMPFVALSAKEMGIAVDGMDDWSKEFNAREDKMAANISTKATMARNILVFSGYSHMSGLAARLNDAGFKSDPLVRQEIENAFSTRVDKYYPRGLASEYDKIIQLVESGKTQYNVDWANKRKTFMNTILSSGHKH